MDYPVNLAPARNWRAAALVAATIATVELLILVTIAFVVFAWPHARAVAEAHAAAPPAKQHPAASQAAKPKPGARAAVAKLPRSKTSVVVLNGNGIQGAADQASTRIQALDYKVTGATNAPRSDFRRTVVMYRRGYEGEAVRLAKDVGAKRVTPLDGLRASDLMGAQIALVLGRR